MFCVDRLVTFAGKFFIFFFFRTNVWMLIIVVAEIMELESFFFLHRCYVLVSFPHPVELLVDKKKKGSNCCIIGRWQYKVRYTRFLYESVFVFCQWEEQRVMGCGLGKSQLQLRKRDKGVGIKKNNNTQVTWCHLKIPLWPKRIFSFIFSEHLRAR